MFDCPICKTENNDCICAFCGSNIVESNKLIKAKESALKCPLLILGNNKYLDIIKLNEEVEEKLWSLVDSDFKKNVVSEFRGILVLKNKKDLKKIVPVFIFVLTSFAFVFVLIFQFVFEWPSYFWSRFLLGSFVGGLLSFPILISLEKRQGLNDIYSSTFETRINRYNCISCKIRKASRPKFYNPEVFFPAIVFFSLVLNFFLIKFLF